MEEKKKKNTPPKGVVPPQLRGKGFDANPENRWTKGKSKSTLASLAKSWESEENPSISKEHLQRIFKMMMGQTMGDIKKISKDNNAPMAVVMLAKGLVNNEKNPEKVFQDMLIWLYGKEVEEIKVTTSASTDHVSEDLREQIKKAALRKLS